MKVKIISVKDGSFGPPEDRVEYFWHTAIRLPENVQFQFGSKKKYEPETELELNLGKSEGADGRVRWKEIA